MQKAGAVVLGISADKSSAQKKFKEKYDLPYSLLADEDKAVAIKYGVLKACTARNIWESSGQPS
jgi:peroxiredoxin Q/BCP